MLEIGKPVNFATLRDLSRGGLTLAMSEAAGRDIDRAAAAVAQIVARGQPAYGVNTGFGRLAQTHIPNDQLELLQRNLVLSHAVGVGDPLPAGVVRLMLALKIVALARGFSGVRRELVDALLALYNADVLPRVPSKGSVGASGDLAPLAHLSTVLLGVGEVECAGSVLTAQEGLALLNGTQTSTALALWNLFAIDDLYATAIVAGALSVDAAEGSASPFDARIHELRGHPGQIAAAAAYRELLADSPINSSHRECGKVQDPYSLRCQPQVMGACADQIEAARVVLMREANGVSDNPLIFIEPGQVDVLSGGNFHAEPVAFAADNLALAVAEIGALAERRIALLIDATLSGLPPFLVKDGGVNSGFMIAHVTAAALASENKSLAHPASVDSLPTAANQEDHVSMATFAARRLSAMAANTAGIVAIELLAAAQGVDFRKPLETAPALRPAMAAIRGRVPFFAADRHMAPEIEKARALVESGWFRSFLGDLLPSSG